MQTLIPCVPVVSPKLKKRGFEELTDSLATHGGERTGQKSLVNSHRAVEPRVPPAETWSILLVMLAQNT